MFEVHATSYAELRGIEPEVEVLRLTVTKVRFTREIRRKLRLFSNLEHLALIDCQIPGDTFAILATFTRLRSLRIIRCRINLGPGTWREDQTWRTELDHLHSIPGLCELDLTATELRFARRTQGSRDFDFLSRMGALTTLVLDETSFDDASVPTLLPLGRLRRLSLNNTRVGARAEQLQQLPALEELNLNGTPAARALEMSSGGSVPDRERSDD